MVILIPDIHTDKPKKLWQIFAQCRCSICQLEGKIALYVHINGFYNKPCNVIIYTHNWPNEIHALQPISEVESSGGGWTVHDIPP